MALLNTITLPDRTPTNRDFSLQNRAGFKVGRIDTSTTLLEPRSITIDHTREGKAGSINERDRHLFQITSVKKDVNGTPHVLTMNLTLSQERLGTHVRADIDDQIAFLRAFLGVPANVDEWVRNGG